MKKVILLLVVAVSLSMFISSCDNDAYVVSQNISQDADNFRIYRRIIFYNAITDKYMFVIEGFSSIYDDGNQLEVTVKTSDGKYLKHYLHLSDNVTYIIEQLDTTKVSDKHYKIKFKPSVLIPTIETDN